MKIIEVDNEIRLKEIASDDVDAIFNTINSERAYLREWLPFVDATHSSEDTQRFVDSIFQIPEADRELTCVIFYNNEFAGIIGFRGTDKQNKKTEIGYWLSEKSQKKGIATRSCSKLIDYAFVSLKMNRIQIRVAIENFKSQRIPERLKFQLEGIERDGELLSWGFTDLKVYSLLAADYFKPIS